MPPKRGGKAPAFPAARVKRIMQQDDEVGKVATASPIVMAKATELFLQEMLNSIEREARAKSTKKVSMYHVKRAVENTPSLDFLKDLVSSIPDPSGGDGDYDSTEKAPKKRPARSKIANGSGGESASPAPQLSSTVASSSSTSTSGLKKIKISHGASFSSSAPAVNNAAASTSNTSTPFLPPMPAPQASSRPNVAIPISSLLSDTGADYGPSGGQSAFGNTIEETKPDIQQSLNSKVDDDDDYDEEETKADTSMQSGAIAPPGEGVSTLQPSTTPYKREEDEDYDEE